jgi:HSP20 family molecular chaperone IbpA
MVPPAVPEVPTGRHFRPYPGRPDGDVMKPQVETGEEKVRTEEGIENGRYVIRAEMPGIDPEKQAEVIAAKGILTIHADRQEDTENSHRSEFRYGSFTRHVVLPATADEADIEVSVRLKTEDTERHIPIRIVQHIKPT